MATPNVVSQPQPPAVDKLAALDAIPLFMKSLPTNDTDDIAISALQSLAYEGTPDEIARNFKEQGNDYFKGKRYREALGFYSQAIDAAPTDASLQEALLSNRAACNLELENFGSVLRDCSKALGINPRSSKALYRSAVALLALDRLEEAVDCCERCLGFDKDNKGVQAVRERAQKAKFVKEEKERERIARTGKDNEAKREIKAAFRQRNIMPIAKVDGPENPYAPRFDPEDPTHGTLIIPTFFLYPEHAMSDVVPNFVEDTSFAAHLAMMFPPDAPAPQWDRKGEYVAGRLVVYATTHRKRVLRVGKKMTLREVLKAAKGKDGEPIDGLELKEGCLSFFVLPKGDVEQKWVEEWKKSRNG